MPTQEDRIVALEQTTVSRIDFLNAVSKLTLQQAQSASDTYHELTILLGVTGSQGRDIKIIKEDVSAIKGEISAIKGEISALKEGVSATKGEISTLKEDVSTIKDRFVSLETKFDEHTTLLTQILERLPEKL